MMRSVPICFHNMRHTKGFTIIEALAFLFLFSLVSAVFLQTYSIGTHAIIESKIRLGAIELANDKMEAVHGLAYDDIGTESGIPAGTLKEYETVSSSGHGYTVHTTVQYADDPFDGTSPDDAIPNDYKRVRIEVSWGESDDATMVALSTNIVPAGVESEGTGGVLSINILDPSGAGVAGAKVRVVNSDVGVDATLRTDSAGNIFLPDAPAGIQNYHLIVSKDSYYGVETYAPYPTSDYYPVDVHATVVAGMLNPKSIVMGKSSDITIKSVDQFGAVVPDVDFRLSGGRILGTDTEGTDKYSCDETLLSTGSDGRKELLGQSYGEYTLAALPSEGYDFLNISTTSSGASMNKFLVTAGVTEEVDINLLKRSVASLKVFVTEYDGTAIKGAVVNVTNADLGYDVSKETDQYGYAVFPDDASSPLASGQYSVSAQASNHKPDTTSVDIDGSSKMIRLILES